MNRIVLTHIDLVTALRELLRAPGSVGVSQAGLSYCETDVEVLAQSFAATGLSLDHMAVDGPALLLGYAPPGNNAVHGTAAELLQRYGPRGFVASLVLQGHGRSTTMDACLRRANGQIEPVHDVRIVGPGMVVLRRNDHDDSPPIVSSSRWSRLIGVIGAQTWERLRTCRFVVVGCGRSGSLIATTLARMGVDELALVDPDRVELHNLDAMDGVGLEALGHAKVEAIANALSSVWPALRTYTCSSSITALNTLPLIKRSQVMISCVDDDGARWAASVLATLYLKPLLDIGTGVFGAGQDRELGVDVRLIVPGEGCVLCCGGLARAEQMATLRNSYTDEVRARTNRDWRRERAGSLRSLNQIAAGLGIRMLEDFFAARTSGSRWVRLTFDSRGEPTLESLTPRAVAGCRLCDLHGMGDTGLTELPYLPLVVDSN
jgi:hypothetical protein